ncbi:MAG: type II toxin-antitoxin system HicB family antitoxin [Patescibacteria group bacterium]|nr:type II toxin-antitoxin system HicB family antitoxin [Patescibacteria group bacterium]
MKNIIQFHIYKGENQYIAECANLSIVTQAETLDQLTENIKEAVKLHLDGENLKELNLSSKPSILLNFELEDVTYV